MPPGTLYSIEPLSRNGMVIWRDDSVFDDLRSKLPVLSENMGEREVLTTAGQPIGEDRWGYLNSGERWRYVIFKSGDAAAYRPLSLSQASSLDRIISTACVSTGFKSDQSKR